MRQDQKQFSGSTGITHYFFVLNTWCYYNEFSPL